MKYGQSRNRYISINEDLSILNNLLYEVKYTYYANKLISHIVKNIEDFYEEEDLSSEEVIHFYNHLSKINFNKSIKESEEYKNLELGWLSLSEDNNLSNNNHYIKELISR